MRRVSALTCLLAACGGDDADLLASLDGAWAGTFATDAGDFPATAEFAWDDEAELLTGEIAVEEAPATPHTYAVRRWETVKDTAYLELTDVTDGTRGLDVSGLVEGSFAGDTTLRYPCDGITCGWQGTFDLQPSTAAPSTPTATTPPATP
jgi:hypothetical protein